MKKISVTTWIVLAGIFLYTASLWQRPLFVSEFAGASEAVDALVRGATPPAGDIPLFCTLKFLGVTPFSFRFIPALLTLCAAGALGLAGRSTPQINTAKAAAMIFLLTPAIFLCGTTAHPVISNGVPVITAFWLLFTMSESSSLLKTLLAGAAAAAVLLLSCLVWGGAVHFLFILTAWSIYAIICILSGNIPEGKKGNQTFFRTWLPFIPALVLIQYSASKTGFQLPRLQDLKTISAFAAAGSFPWVIFLPVILRNFPVRIASMVRERFTLAALVLAVSSLSAALFTPFNAGFMLPCLGGIVVLFAAGLEMEHAENGFHSANVVLYILAALFFLCAAAAAAYSILGLYTKLLDPAWKIFSAKDAWMLSAVVPAVTAVWCLTAAGEKISKERKFLSLCAGAAFVLLAFHGLVPLKVIEYNAPGNFLRKVVMVRTGTKPTFYGDADMFPALQSVFKNSIVKRFSAETSIPEIKKALHEKEKLCFVTRSRTLSEKLPFPKTTLRSGSFTAVFYNIDFPEMRVRKP